MQIIPQYSILTETVELLYKFVNNLTLDNIRRNFQLRHGERLDASERRHYDAVLDALEHMLREATHGLDRNDARLQAYFRNLQPDAGRDWACLAQILLCSFYDGESHTFDEGIAECRRMYSETVSQGWEKYKIVGIDRAGLSFVPIGENEEEQPLFDQLDAYEIPNGCKWTIYKELEDYDAALAELTQLLRPIAERLEKLLRHYDGLVASTVRLWEDYFASNSFAVCKQTMMGVTGQEAPEAPKQIVRFWWLGCNQMHYYQDERREVLNVGMLVCPGISPKSTRYAQENLVNILKFLSDNSKFEILRRLSERSCYGLELANEMQLTSGTISKHLNALFSYGLINLQRVNNRVYYQTDRDAVRRFLKELEEGLLGSTAES